jgi:glucosamine-phosphate N-acetyltransferase
MSHNKKVEKVNYTNICMFLKENYDYLSIIKKKFLELCKNLSDSPDISEYLFIQNILKINENGILMIAYVGDPSSPNFEIVSTGTVFIGPKIIHGGKSVAHIEDIIVHEKYRRNGIATHIIETLKTYAQENGCYKVILNCNECVKSVYEKCGFSQKGLQMALYF